MLRKKKEPVKKETTESIMSGLLGIGSRFEGEIKFSGTFRLDGKMRGRIICKGDAPSTVIISEDAKVDAEIVTDNLIVSGELVGDIRAVERVEIHAPGRIEGKVYTCDLVIEDGALFQGECVMIRHYTEEQKKELKSKNCQGLIEREIPEISEGVKTEAESPEELEIKTEITNV